LLIEQLRIPLSEEQIAIVSTCNWSEAKHWVNLGVMMDKRKSFTNVEQTICKGGSAVWNKASKSTKSLERANSLSKNRRKHLFCVM